MLLSNNNAQRKIDQNHFESDADDQGFLGMTPSATYHYVKITQLERENLDLSGNLSDAQVYLPLTEAQLDCLPGAEFFLLPRREIQIGVEKQRFIDAFKASYAGLSVPDQHEMMFCYSASMAIEIVANSMRLAGRKRVMLLHPTYDTSSFILKRHGLDLLPLEEASAFGETAPWRSANILPPDVIFLTVPNNPTGTQPSAEAFAALCRSCCEAGVALVLDCCFRAYSDRVVDHYAIIRETGVSAAVIEDTGKLFNIKDVKLGTLWVNGAAFSDALDIHRDFILDVPLFNLVTLRRLLAVSGPGHLDGLRRTVAVNRAAAVAGLAPLGLKAIGGAESNVQLFALPEGASAEALYARAMGADVGIVRADGYYWQSRGGDRLIRLALAREPAEFGRLLARLMREIAPAAVD